LNTLQDIPIVKAALAYDEPESGENIILIFNQALHFGNKLPNILLNPNQMWSQGLTVDDCPKHLSRGKSTHSIIIEEENVIIPLRLRGIMSYFNVRIPSAEEIDQCLNIQITPEHLEWEPYSDMHMEQEGALNEGDPNADTYSHRMIQANTSINTNHDDMQDVLIKLNLWRTMKNRMNAATTTVEKNFFWKEDELARKWAIGKQVAHDTIKDTTQSFVRNVMHPIERRFKSVQAWYANEHTSLASRFLPRLRKRWR
jgi:hypothetical protein